MPTVAWTLMACGAFGGGFVTLAAPPMPPEWVQPLPPAADAPKPAGLATGDEPWLPVFSKLSLADALAQSIEQKKLLVIVWEDPRSQELNVRIAGRRSIYENRVLAYWLKWHAIVLNAADPTSGAAGVPLSREFLGPYCDPVVFKNGKKIHMAGAQFERTPGNIYGQNGKRDCFKPIDIITDPHGAFSCLSAACLLVRLDLTLEAERAGDVVWSTQHDRLNPEPPEPPALEPFWMNGDANGAAVVEPVVGGEGRTVAGEKITPQTADLLAVLDDARQAAAAGDWRTAVGAYSYWWERAEQVDPAAAPVRRAILLAEIRTMVQRVPGAKTRFEVLYNDAAIRLAWADVRQYHDWMALATVIGESISGMLELDMLINDPDQVVTMPTPMKQSFGLLSSHLPDANSWWRDPVAVDRLNAIVPAVVKGGGAWPTDGPGMFAAQLLLVRACEAHARLLQEGHEARAWKAAEIALKHPDRLLARRALVMAALSVGQARPEHRVYLEDLRAVGLSVPALEGRVEERLRAR